MRQLRNSDLRNGFCNDLFIFFTERSPKTSVRSPSHSNQFFYSQVFHFTTLCEHNPHHFCQFLIRILSQTLLSYPNFTRKRRLGCRQRTQQSRFPCSVRPQQTSKFASIHRCVNICSNPYHTVFPGITGRKTVLSSFYKEKEKPSVRMTSLPILISY